MRMAHPWRIHPHPSLSIPSLLQAWFRLWFSNSMDTILLDLGFYANLSISEKLSNFNSNGFNIRFEKTFGVFSTRTGCVFKMANLKITVRKYSRCTLTHHQWYLQWYHQSYLINEIVVASSSQVRSGAREQNVNIWALLNVLQRPLKFLKLTTSSSEEQQLSICNIEDYTLTFVSNVAS
jgi:hypothetical protein